MQAFRREIMRWSRYGALYALIRQTVSRDNHTAISYVVDRYGYDGRLEQSLDIPTSVGVKMESMLNEIRMERNLIGLVSNHGVSLFAPPDNIPKIISFGELQGMGITRELAINEIIKYKMPPFDMYLRVKQKSPIGYRFQPALILAES